MMGYVNVDKGHDVESNLMNDLNPKGHVSEGKRDRCSRRFGTGRVLGCRRYSRHWSRHPKKAR